MLFRIPMKSAPQSVIPAFQALADCLKQLESIAPTDDGVWQFPHGDEYYTYLLQHYTTTEMTAEEIHQLGLQELERIHAEMRTLFDELGYPQDESLSKLYDRVARDGGSVSGTQVVETYEAFIEQADQNLDAAFDMRPVADVIVIGGSIGGLCYMQKQALSKEPQDIFKLLGCPNCLQIENICSTKYCMLECETSCLKKAITIENEHVSINAEKCNLCNQCLFRCPLNAINKSQLEKMHDSLKCTNCEKKYPIKENILVLFSEKTGRELYPDILS